MGHVVGENLTDTADVLSRWHLGQLFKDIVSLLVKDKGVRLLIVPDKLFLLSESLSSSYVTGYSMLLGQ